jgi:uncharacterized protein YkwD
MRMFGFVSRCGRARLAATLVIAGCSTAPLRPSPSRPSTVPAPNGGYGREQPPTSTPWRSTTTGLFQRPGQPVPVQTVVGVAAVREAAADVRSERPPGALTLSTDLTRAARDHALDQQRTGEVGHTGSDDSSVDTRVRRYGTWVISISENIDYSPAVHGGDVIQNLLIDDGVPDRGHRRNIYGSTARVVGIACEPHPRYGSVCVIVQAGGFTPK